VRNHSISQGTLWRPSDQVSSRLGRTAHALASKVRGRQVLVADGRPPKLAVLSDAFVRYGSAQAIELHKAGANVVFYYVDRLGEFAGDWSERETFLKRVRHAGIEAVPLPQRDMTRLAHQVRWLRKDLRARRIDLAIVQQHIDPRYATLGFQLPTVLILHDPQTHSGDYASTYPAPVRWLARFAEVTASALILHSESLTTQLRALLRYVPVGFAPHGADIAEVPAEIRDPHTILLVGRMMEYKGIFVAIDAFKRLRVQNPDCRLTLAGQGNIGDEIRRQLVPGVQFHDRYIPEEEMHEMLRGAAVVLLPYLDATQSGVGLQAIAQGIPCVVSDTGGLPDLVPPNRPWVAPPNDPEALALAVSDALTQDSETRLELLRFASERFAWPVAARALLDELKRLCLLPDSSVIPPTV
jgi:glycosyltransferase involved in cell wall biosynthesis